MSSIAWYPSQVKCCSILEEVLASEDKVPEKIMDLFHS
jgi:hypothetical protein